MASEWDVDRDVQGCAQSKRGALCGIMCAVSGTIARFSGRPGEGYRRATGRSGHGRALGGPMVTQARPFQWTNL